MAKNNNGQGDSISRSLQSSLREYDSWILWYAKAPPQPPTSALVFPAPQLQLLLGL